MSWKQKLQELGIDNSNMPSMIKKAVRDLKTFEDRLNQIDQTLDKGNVSDIRRSELQDERETMVDSIEAQQDVISEKIDMWNRNKDMYKQKSEKMRAAMLAKKGGQTQSDSTQTATAPATAVAEPQPVVAEVIAQPEKKKGSSGAKVVLGLIILGLTFGAYNYFKNNES